MITAAAISTKEAVGGVGVLFTMVTVFLRAGRGRGITRGRGLIGDSKGGAGGIWGFVRRCVGRSDEELKVGGLGRILQLR